RLAASATQRIAEATRRSERVCVVDGPRNCVERQEPGGGTNPGGTPAPSALRRAVCCHTASSRRYATRWSVDSLSHESRFLWSASDHASPERRITHWAAAVSIASLFTLRPLIRRDLCSMFVAHRLRKNAPCQTAQATGHVS